MLNLLSGLNCSMFQRKRCKPPSDRNHTSAKKAPQNTTFWVYYHFFKKNAFIRRSLSAPNFGLKEFWINYRANFLFRINHRNKRRPNVLFCNGVSIVTNCFSRFWSFFLALIIFKKHNPMFYFSTRRKISTFWHQTTFTAFLNTELPSDIYK